MLSDLEYYQFTVRMPVACQSIPYQMMSVMNYYTFVGNTASYTFQATVLCLVICLHHDSIL